MTCRLLLAAVLASVCLTASGCATDPTEAAKEYIASGDRYAAQKKFKHAIIQYRNAVKHNPESGEAHLRLAEAYERDGDAAASFRMYLKAAELLPDHARVQIKAGQLELLAGEFGAAKARAERVLERNRRNVDAQILRANALAGLDDLDAAAAQMQQAVNQDSSRSDAYTNLGTLLRARGKPDDAERAYRRAVSLAPYSVPARLATADFYWTTGRPAEAERQLTEALESTGGHPDIHRALAFFYLSTGRSSSAEQHLRKAVDAAQDDASRLALADYYEIVDRPSDALAVLESVAAGGGEFAAEAVARIAAIQVAQGRLREAEHRLDALLAERPGNTTARLAKARLLLVQNRPEEALAVVQRALRSDPDSLQTRLWRARALAAQGSLDEAQAAYEEILAARPRLVPAQIELAEVQLDAGHPADALELTRTALAAQPDDPGALILHAEALYRTGDRAGAATAMREAAARLPDSAALHARLASAYVGMGDVSSARAAYARAHRLDPDDAIVANNLAWLLAETGARKDLDTALALAQHAHARREDRAEISHTLGWIYYLKGETRSALPLLRASVERQPENPRYRLHLGLASLDAGDENGACRALRTALRLDEQFEGADEARSAIARLRQCHADGRPVSTAGPASR
ncbi:MAG TPA: tetratricopeptide repeat protein [Vicinamibacterales bacterium]|nr:tetratricopeptide repeat protein [Vicinamibacterales bacterium]